MEKKLQVWWTPQVPMKLFTVDIKDVAEGVKIMDVLADYDRFQYENKVKPDYCNMGGINQWCEEDQEWESWYDDETGADDPKAWLEEQTAKPVTAKRIVGKVLPEKSLLLRVAAGSAEADGVRYELNYSAGGTPIVCSGKTGQWYVLDWQDILNLAEENGIDIALPVKEEAKK